MKTDSRRWALRQHTAEAHAVVDAAIGDFFDLESYRTYLARVAGFRLPIERQLGRLSWPAHLAGWRPKLVAQAIISDLADLGQVAHAVDSPSITCLDDTNLLGVLYVLEGSALGAHLLYRRASALGLSAAFGAKHLSLLGGSIDNWREFLERLERADPFDLDNALKGSLLAFDLAREAFRTT